VGEVVTEASSLLEGNGEWAGRAGKEATAAT
jgi:hypothetical protein